MIKLNRPRLGQTGNPGMTLPIAITSRSRADRIIGNSLSLAISVATGYLAFRAIEDEDGFVNFLGWTVGVFAGVNIALSGVQLVGAIAGK